MTHLLVTNDFPPKVGGIQNYLWELYRRMDPADVAVFTTPYDGDAVFDAAQGFRIERFERFFLSPTPDVLRRIETIAARVGAESVLFDPAIPVGALGPRLTLPYAVVLHGAEVTVPARLPGLRNILRSTIDQASLVVSASEHARDEAEQVMDRSLPAVWVPPGVDVARFRPVTAEQKAEVRRRFGVPDGAPFVLSVSRLVPRKGMDTLIDATSKLTSEFPDVVTLIAGSGRDTKRLQGRIDSTRAPVRLVGRVAHADLPLLYAAADVFVMLCRIRWGGLEQEGFGIVFLEAAACEVPQVAGHSGGAADAVADGETGIVVNQPDDADEAAAAIARLLRDETMRADMGRRGRARACAEFSYDLLADRLATAMKGLGS